MPKTIFYNIPAHGHINPTLALVTELVRRGEQVLGYNLEAFRSKLEGAGAVFRPYPLSKEPEPGQTAGNPFVTIVEILRTGAAMLSTLIAAARAERPDYIIYDSMAPWGKQVAEVLGVPAIASCSVYFVGSRNFSAFPRDWAIMSQTLAGLPTMIVKSFEYRQVAAQIKKQFGVNSPALLDFFTNPGDLTLIYTSRYFQVGADRLDDTFKFVGPSIGTRLPETDFPFGFLDGGPVIYISLGTIFNDHPKFFRACLEAFGNGSYRVVMSTGQKIHAKDLGPIPGNFLVRSHHPQLDILQRAALFLTHGGMNSASESAWFGVPMIVVPQIGDQHFVAQQVQQLGAGLRLATAQVTASSLRATAERILADQTYRQHAQTIGDSFRASGGYMKAADEILSFVSRAPARL